jgi:hypothetical protein
VTGLLRNKRLPAFVGDPIHLPTIKTSVTAEAWSKKGHFYKSLQTRFRHDGFDYQEIHHEGDFAIYRQTWGGNEHSAAFEIIHIRRHDGFHIEGRFVEPGEIYPKSETWGTDGWTMQDKDAALRKLREVRMFYKKESANPVKKSPIQESDRCLGALELGGDVNDRCDG